MGVCLHNNRDSPQHSQVCHPLVINSNLECLHNNQECLLWLRTWADHQHLSITDNQECHLLLLADKCHPDLVCLHNLDSLVLSLVDR